MGFVEHGRLGGAGYEDGPVVVARNVLGAARKWWKCCEAFLKISPDAVVPVLNLLLSAALCLLEDRATLSLCRSELFLCTPINVLYMLPLSCPVTRVDVHDESSEFEAAGLRQVLLDTTPVNFSLKTRWMGASCYLDRNFVDTLSQPELWRSVKTLELFVCIRYADKDIVLDDMLVRLRSWAFHALHKLTWSLSG